MKDTPLLIMLKEKRPQTYALLRKSRDRRQEEQRLRTEADKLVFWKETVVVLERLTKKMNEPKGLDISDTNLFFRLVLEVFRKL